MKRFLITLIIVVLIAHISLADESIVINFSDLVDDYQGENRATVVDFSTYAGNHFTEEEKQGMITSLYVPNWEVRLSKSSRTVKNSELSYTLPVNVGEDASVYAGQQVLGVRIHFPELPQNSYAWVKPPFAIPAFSTNDLDEDAVRGSQFDNLGAVKNVGVLRSLDINVFGMNYPVGLAVILKDQNEVQYTIKLGYLDFVGWKTLSWSNPNYITEVRNRVLKKSPLYPREVPYMVLDSIEFYKDAMHEGGDFISYVKDISITYDLALDREVDVDLKHEEIWNILADREDSRRSFEMSALSNREVLRFMEKRRMHTEEPEEGAAPAAATE